MHLPLMVTVLELTVVAGLVSKLHITAAFSVITESATG